MGNPLPGQSGRSRRQDEGLIGVGGNGFSQLDSIACRGCGNNAGRYGGDDARKRRGRSGTSRGLPTSFIGAEMRER